MKKTDNFNLTIEECKAVLDALDELIITDGQGRIKYVSKDIISKQQNDLGYESGQKYIGEHVSKVIPTSFIDSFLNSSEQEKIIFHFASSSGTITRFKKIPGANEKTEMVIDYDLFKNEMALKLFVDELVSFDSSGLLVLGDSIENIKKRMQHMANKNDALNNIIGVSDSINSLKKMIFNISHSLATVLISGETGTGKELFAHAIYSTSPRAAEKIIEVNSAAIPENLFESEMFGYNDGAFTGAKRGGMKGKFELADKGTLFLDEIDQIPYHIQPKLLRVLQEQTIDKIGGESVPIDVRIIASTNKNIRELVNEGKFREDLFYRLNIINLEIPPLRDRKEDITVLVKHFIKKFNEATNAKVEEVSPEAMELLYAYDWPGNVRELRNQIQKAMLIAKEPVLKAEDFPDLKNLPVGGNANYNGYIGETLEEICENAERTAIIKTLQNSNSKTEAADKLGITRPTLYFKIKKYGIDV